MRVKDHLAGLTATLNCQFTPGSGPSAGNVAFTLWSAVLQPHVTHCGPNCLLVATIALTCLRQLAAHVAAGCAQHLSSRCGSVLSRFRSDWVPDWRCSILGFGCGEFANGNLHAAHNRSELGFVSGLPTMDGSSHKRAAACMRGLARSN